MKIVVVVLILWAFAFLNVSGVYLHKYPARIIRVRRQQPTPAPVTDAPTTAAPGTVAPTTAAPVTVAPTTAAPVTVAPTTAAPVTVSPTTASPTTAAPVTVAPTTAAPAPITTVTPSPTTIPTVPTTSAPRKIRFRFRIKFRRNRNPFPVFPRPNPFSNNFPFRNSVFFDRSPRLSLFRPQEPKREFPPRNFRQIDFSKSSSNYSPFLDLFSGDQNLFGSENINLRLHRFPKSSRNRPNCNDECKRRMI